MSGLTSVDGIISGLKTSDIIDAIMAVERRRVTLLEARQARANTELLSYQSMSAKLLLLQSDADALSRAATFDSRSATSSNTDIITASAASRAPVGTYDLTVTAIARTHQIASQGFADTTSAALGTGTLGIAVADNTTTVTIDNSNNTLEGLRDAINADCTNVRATIINDGGATHQYRLLLTSTSTGLANTISITNNLAGGTSPDFSAAAITAPLPANTNSYTGSAAAAGAYTGASGKTYIVQIVDAGAIGAATFRVSEDGGTTWGSAQTLNATIDVYDNLNGSDLGAKMTFTAGEFAAGDQFTIRAFVPTVQQAADAKIEIGSGAGKIEITSATNRVTDAIPGVTISLVSADASKTVTLEIAPDKTAIASRVKSLITNFNNAVDYITSQSGYDSTSRTAGVLLGNTTMIRLQGDLRSTLLTAVSGNAKYNSLFSLGLSIRDNGSLSLNESTLAAALEDGFDDVARIFKTTGTSTNAKIAFINATSATRESVAGYDVNITQAASRGRITGTVIDDPASTPLVIDSTNNQLIVTVDGTTSQILQLTQKTYTSGAALALEIQTRINQDSYLSGKGVAVSYADEGATGYLEIRSSLYGAGSSVSIGSPANNAAGVLGLADATAAAGTDVAGTINGEAATGNGQFLTGNTGNAYTAGIKLRVTLEPEDLAEGAQGAISITKGVGTKLTELTNGMTHSVDGVLAAKSKTAQTQIDNASSRIKTMEAALEIRRKRLVAKFTAMEKALAAMQTQSSYIGLQLAALTNRQQ